MPTYQYACTACEHRFDQVQAFSDASLTVCPECSGKLRKLYGSVGVVFKGSGFYRTDSRSSAKSSTVPAESSGDSTAKSDKAMKSESKSTESKPAAKSESASSTTSKSAATAKAS